MEEITSKHFATDYHQLMIMAEYLTFAEIADLLYRVNQKALGGAISEVYDTIRYYHEITQSRIKIGSQFAQLSGYRALKTNGVEPFGKNIKPLQPLERFKIEKEIREQIYDELFGRKVSFVNKLSGIDINNIAFDNIPDWAGVYVIRSFDLFKIGMSVSSIRDRIRTHYHSNPQLEIVMIVRADDPGVLEAMLHSRFSDKREKGEWFRLSGDDLNELHNIVSKMQDKIELDFQSRIIKRDGFEFV